MVSGGVNNNNPDRITSGEQLMRANLNNVNPSQKPNNDSSLRAQRSNLPAEASKFDSDSFLQNTTIDDVGFSSSAIPMGHIASTSQEMQQKLKALDINFGEREEDNPFDSIEGEIFSSSTDMPYKDEGKILTADYTDTFDSPAPDFAAERDEIAQASSNRINRNG